MTNRKIKQPTGQTAEELSEELLILSVKMDAAAYHIKYFGGMDAEKQMRARELSGAADMVYEWARDVKKEEKK